MRFPLFETRVGRRLVMLFLLAAVAPIGVTAVVAYRHVVGILDRQSRERLDALAKATGMDVGRRLEELQDVLEARATVLAATGRRPPTVAPGKLPGVVALDLEPLGSTPFAEPGSTIDRLREGLPALVVGDADHTLRLGVRVRGSDRVLWGQLDLDFVFGLTEQSSGLPRDVTLCVLSADGAPLACPASDPEMIAALRAASEGRRRFGWTGKGETSIGSDWELFLGYAFGVPSWRIGVAEDVAAIRQPLSSFTRTFVQIVALTFFFVLWLSAFLIRRNLSPLRRLREATVRLANHEFAYRVPIEVRRRDEFLDLATSFNLMAGQLEQHVDTLQAINALDRSILSTLDRRGVTEVVLEHASALVDADILAFGLARLGEPADPSWDFTVRPSRSATARSLSIPLPPAEHALLSDAPSGAAISPAMLLALRQHPVMTRTGVAAGWVFPVIQGARPVGMLVLGFRQQTTLEGSARLRLRHLVDQAAVALANVGLVEELGQLQRGALLALAATIDAKSHWTAGHSERVTTTAVALGEWMGLPEDDLERLNRGGLLHDIGKIAVPLQVLDKVGSLTDDERDLIESHPVIGARILGPIKPFGDIVAIVRSHHERWDGLGYPDQLSGDAIPRLARVLSVADVFDAVSSARPYRAAMPRAEAIQVIRDGIGTFFDPAIANAFLAMVARTDGGSGAIPHWTPRDLMPPTGQQDPIRESLRDLVAR